MKRCPECRRDYTDETLNFCLDDGSALLEGPALMDEPATAVLSIGGRVSDEHAAKTFDQEPITGRASLDGTTHTSSNRNSLIAGLIGIVLVSALGVGSYLYYARGSTKQISAIAVMPFVNASGSSDMEYLSDGITETLIGSLSQLSGLNVKAPSSVFRYKGKDVGAQTVGRELNVQALLNGRVVQRGDDLTLYLSLVDTSTEDQIWGKQYNRKLTNLVTLQTEIAQDVALNLRAKLTGAEEHRLAETDTTDPEAHQLYLHGRFHWKKRTPESINKAIDYFKQAIALDPNYARAWAGLADAYAAYIFRNRVFDREYLIKGREAAEKALKLDDASSEAHSAFGNILLADYDFTGAERELKHAIGLDQDNAWAHLRYAVLLRNLGRFDEAVAEHSRALEIEPLWQQLYGGLGQTLMAQQRYEEAIIQFRKALDIEPNAPDPLALTGIAYMLKGDHHRAVEYLEKSFEISVSAEFAAGVRKSYADGGWPGYLRYVIKERRDIHSPYRLASTYLQLGDKDEAFRQLNRSFEVREPNLINLKVNPVLEGLRDDPRYNELVRKVGFPE